MASALPSPASGRLLPGPTMPDTCQMPRSIHDLNTALDVLEPFAHELQTVEKALLEREAQILEELLRRAGSLLAMYSHNSRHYYHGELILLDEIGDVYEDESGGFKTRVRLIYFDNGRLVRRLDVSSWGHHAIKIDDDSDLSFEAAVQSFGLEAICAGLQDALRNFPIHCSLLECRKRLLAATQIIHELRCTSQNGENIRHSIDFKGGENA